MPKLSLATALLESYFHSAQLTQTSWVYNWLVFSRPCHRLTASYWLDNCSLLPYLPWPPPSLLIRSNHIFTQPILEPYFHSTNPWIIFSLGRSLNHIFTQPIFGSYFHSSNPWITFSLGQSLNHIFTQLLFNHVFTQSIFESYLHLAEPKLCRSLELARIHWCFFLQTSTSFSLVIITIYWTP